MKKFSQFIHWLYCLDESHRNKGIEGLRALAVLMVFNTHALSYFYFNNFFIENNTFLVSLFNFIQSGHFGVDIFFVISGYLIYKTTIKSDPSFFQYFRRRFMRLMPAHLVVLAYVIPSGFLLINLIENVFFLPAFIRNIPSYNFVTWSLGWEWLFYLSFFILFKILKARSTKYFIFGILLFTLLLFLLTCPDLPIASLLKGKYDIPIPGRFFGFFIGIFFSQLAMSKSCKKLRGRVSLFSIFGLIGFIFWIWVYSVYRETPQFNSYFYLNLYFLVLDILVGMIILGLVFTTRETLVSRLFSFTPFRILGQISYSFYLVHAAIGIPLAIHFINVKSLNELFLFYAISFLISFVISTVVFLGFERPFLSKSLGFNHQSKA